MKVNKNILLTLTWWLLVLVLFGLWLNFFLGSNDSHSAQNGIVLTSEKTAIQADLGKISRYHLMGSSSDSSLNLGAVANRETQLNLSITGILANQDPTLGTAYINNNQGEEKKFSSKDNVFGMATLEEVHHDHLILLHNGKKEKLSLQKHLSSSGNAQISESTDNSAASERIKRHINSNGGNWQAVLNRQKFDPQKIASIVGNVNPVQDSQGRIKSLRVSALTQNSPLKKQGLKSNDQIVAVNGIDVNQSNIINISNQIQNANSAQITVLRNNRKVELTVNLNELKQ